MPVLALRRDEVCANAVFHCAALRLVPAVQDYTHFHLDTNLTQVDVNAPITTFNLALLGVLANLHGSVSPQYRPFVDVLMQAISRWAGMLCR